MKVLILGATGMAGHTISIYLQEKGYEVFTFTRKDFFVGTNLTGDALNKDFLSELLSKESFSHIINCIGILNSDCEENKSNAVFLNSYLPHFIADSIKNTKTKLIHLSTDCVFSGETGPYDEKSFKDGSTFYDLTKSVGEVNDSENLTFRNSIIGPDISTNGIGLFNWFMGQNEDIEGYANVFWSGITTLALAKAIEKSLLENISGIYHLTNNKKISKYELLTIFNKHFKDNEIKISKNTKNNSNKQLINTRSDFNFTLPDYEQMIIEMKQWIVDHKELYSHYQL